MIHQRRRGRKSGREAAMEVLEAFGLAAVGAPGYEAEDVIASLVKFAKGPVEILSGDRDLADRRVRRHTESTAAAVKHTVEVAVMSAGT